MHYSHLTQDQRSQISAYKSMGLSHRTIALKLEVASTTIDREIKRNGYRIGGLKEERAHQRALNRRREARSKPTKLTIDVIKIIEEKIRFFVSPIQISGWLKLRSINVSHETIYRLIAKDRRSGGDLYKYLRRKGKKLRKKRCQGSTRGAIKDRVDISQRPPEVETKSRIGDLEIDTIVGARGSGYLVTAVDRCSKAVFITKTKTKEANVVTKALLDRLNLARTIFMPRTMTCDNGPEFAFHKQITAALGIPVFFATPYRSWERGLNEHTNGLIRQFAPKKSSFADLSDDDTFMMEFYLNNRPRKALNFRTPLEVLLSHATAALHG